MKTDLATQADIEPLATKAADCTAAKRLNIPLIFGAPRTVGCNRPAGHAGPHTAWDDSLGSYPVQWEDGEP